MIGELGSSGGESHLIRVECLVADGLPGTLRVVKIYNRGMTVDEQALGRLKTMDRDHVIGLAEWGFSDGHWYEVQEHIDGGSLYDLRDREKGFDETRLHEVVVELVRAVHGVHAAGVLHKDVKPANVLVRRDDQLDLVLGDFGLAIASNLSKHYVSNSRTPQYASPEVFLNTYYQASDWWSVGMSVAELALGSHPLAELHELAVGSAIRERPIELDGVADERIRSLCRGLLIPDHTRRWGWDQIEKWLAGENPEVPEWSAVPYRTQGFEFDGQVFTDTVALAFALGSRWSDAARLVRGGPHQTANLRSFLAQFSTHHRIAAVLDDWDDGGVAPDRRVAQLLVALDPHLPFLPFRDVDVSPGGLRGLAGEVVSEGSDSPQAGVLTDLQQHGILGIYGTMQGQERIAAIERRWSASERQAIQALAAAGRPAPSDEIRLTLKAQSLLVAVDDHAARIASWRARWIAMRHGRHATWLRPLRKRLAQPGYAIAVVALQDEIRGAVTPGASSEPDGARSAPIRSLGNALPARAKAVALCAVMTAAALYAAGVAMAIDPSRDLETQGAAIGRLAATVGASWWPYLMAIGALVVLLFGKARSAVVLVGALGASAVLAGAGAFDSVQLPLRDALTLPADVQTWLVDLGSRPGPSVAAAAGASALVAVVLAIVASSALSGVGAGANPGPVRRTVHRQQMWLGVVAVVGLVGLGINSAARFQETDEGVPRSGPAIPVNAWIAQLASLPVSQGATVRDAMLADVRSEVPEAQVLRTDDFSSLSPGFWVLYLPQAFSSGSEVIAWCDSNGRESNDDCYAAYLSHSASEKGRYCVRAKNGSLSGDC
jgi:hypothetical protein